MRFAYADPPYLGQGQKLYGHPEWDTVARHADLIEQLRGEFPDGWAMSLSSPSLRELLPRCPADVRVAAWVKPFCAFKRGVRPCYGWEPVIFRGGRNKHHPPPEKNGKQTTPKDFHAASITLKKGLTGAKPESFCRWVLDLLNVQPGDVLIDMFPGTGVMGVCAEARTNQQAPASWWFPSPGVQHGENCLKVQHANSVGYLHAAEDDTPYDVDGVVYCGRCHAALSEAKDVPRG